MIVSGVSSILLYHFPFKIYIVASALIALVVAYFLIKNFKRLTV